MKNFRINIEGLDLKEILILALITSHSDFTTYVSNISRERLSNESGIKKLDTISKYTNSLEKKGKLTKRVYYKNDKKRIEYSVNKPNSRYVTVLGKVFELDAKLIGFLIKLADLRWRGTSEIRLTDKLIYEGMGISRTTFTALRNAALASGALSTTENGYSLSSDYFPVTTSIPAKVRKYVDEIRQFKAQGGQLTESMVILLDWAEKGFVGVNMSPEKTLTLCQSGCLVKGFTSKKEVESESFAI